MKGGTIAPVATTVSFNTSDPRVNSACVDIYSVLSYCASLYWVISCQDFNEDIVNREIFYINEVEAEKMIADTIPHCR